jgi:hypothetical protein
MLLWRYGHPALVSEALGKNRFGKETNEGIYMKNWVADISVPLPYLYDSVVYIQKKCC